MFSKQKYKTKEAKKARAHLWVLHLPNLFKLIKDIICPQMLEQNISNHSINHLKFFEYIRFIRSEMLYINRESKLNIPFYYNEHKSHKPMTHSSPFT